MHRNVSPNEQRLSERAMDDGGEDHPRLVIHNSLTPDECKELEFIHKSCGAVGYRPNVFSTTLSHLIATNSAHLIMPFVPIRERIKEKVEEFFGCEFELFIEFTGLISWSRGASIGWHSDDNKPYLRQRDFAAVCYLNSHGKDFKGGHFHFQDGEPTTIVPLAGDAVMYTADSRNIHSVDEIIEGERLTLTLWFSRDSSHDEDAKLVSRLSQRLLQSSVNAHDSYLPSPASSSMYWFSPVEAPNDQLGFDILWARMHILGYDIYFSQDTSCFLDVSELLMEPLKLARGCKLFHQEFRNILHALQVVQFYCWKASELPTAKDKVEMGKVTNMSQSQLDKISHLKSIYSKDNQQVEAVFGYATGQHHFDWPKFSAAIDAWEDYTCRLHNEMVMSLPHWKTHQSIFCVST